MGLAQAKALRRERARVAEGSKRTSVAGEVQASLRGTGCVKEGGQRHPGCKF